MGPVSSGRDGRSSVWASHRMRGNLAILLTDNLPTMSIDRIRKDIAAAAANDGKVDANEVDAIATNARDGGGIDEGERAELLEHADGFEDGAKSRVQRHLATGAQKAAFVNTEVKGELARTEGGFAVMTTTVPG